MCECVEYFHSYYARDNRQDNKYSTVQYRYTIWQGYLPPFYITIVENVRE